MIECTKLVGFQPTGESLDCLFATKIKLPPFTRMELAYNNTFVIEDKNTTIKHVNQETKKLAEIKIKNVQNFMMLSEDKVVILSVKDKDKFYMLTFWNLIDKSTVNFQIPVAFNQNYGFSMIFFKDSEVLCVCENQLNATFRLSYFKIPMYDKVPFHQANFESPTNQPLDFKKLNEHSMVGFIPRTFNARNKNIQFHTYNLNQKNIQGQTLKHSFEQWFYTDKYLMKQFNSLKILDIAEVRPMVFYILLEVCYGYVGSQFHTFYWDYQNQSIQASRLNISSQHRVQFISCLRDVDCELARIIYEEDKLRSVYSVKNQRKMVTNLPIYYVEPQTQKIIGSHPLKNKIYQTICWPSYKSDRILQYYCNQKEETVVEIRKIPDRWQLYWQGLPILSTFLMTQLVEECDEDLLMGVMELLPASLETFFRR